MRIIIYEDGYLLAAFIMCTAELGVLKQYNSTLHDLNSITFVFRGAGAEINYDHLLCVLCRIHFAKESRGSLRVFHLLYFLETHRCSFY